MKIEVDKKDLVRLICGISLTYKQMEEIGGLGLGSYTGGFHDKWDWYPWSLEKYTEDELYALYLKIKKA